MKITENHNRKVRGLRKPCISLTDFARSEKCKVSRVCLYDWVKKWPLPPAVFEGNKKAARVIYYDKDQLSRWYDECDNKRKG